MSYSSHQAPVLDARVQITQSNSHAAISGPACRISLLALAVLLGLEALRARGDRSSTTHGRRGQLGGGCRSALQSEYFHHPLIPDFAVVGLTIHGNDNLTIVRDVQRGLRFKVSTASAHDGMREERGLGDAPSKGKR